METSAELFPIREADGTRTLVPWAEAEPIYADYAYVYGEHPNGGMRRLAERGGLTRAEIVIVKREADELRAKRRRA